MQASVVLAPPLFHGCGRSFRAESLGDRGPLRRPERTYQSPQVLFFVLRPEEGPCVLFEARAQGVARRSRGWYMYHIGGRRLSYHNSGWRWGISGRRREHVARRGGVVAGWGVAVGVAARRLWWLRHRPEGFAARHGAARAELEQQDTRLSLFLSAVRCGVELRAVVCCAATFLRVYLCNLCWSRAKCRPRLSSSLEVCTRIFF